ncbi:MAG TPA: hypothetical protein VJP40_07020, partial [bacterium]|nr:hypothetical protein [bacterium]
VPQAGMLVGIGLARRLEEALGLRPRVDNATFFTDTLSTYLQFFVSGRLADRAFGPRFQALQAALNWRRPSPGERGGRAFPGLSLATPEPTAPRQGTRPGSSIQDLMQAPSLSKSYDDGGDGKSSEDLRYGYGADTIMGIWFPSQAKPSNAVPIFTSAIDQIPLMLRSAYRHRPDRQQPRTILLEPSLGALQQISPKAALIPQLLNSLTKGSGEQFPDKTPFRIMQIAERRTFVAKVTERRLTWLEENDPIWARINRHSVSNEFEAETPLELYLYIESLTRQPRPSPKTDYLVRYRGRSPASYGTTLEKFIERSLKIYRIVGKSFSVEFGDGQAAQRFITLNEDWMIEDSGIAALPKPASAAPLELAPKSPESSRPVFSKELSLAASKKAPAISPFSVITSFQALKDVGGLLSDPSLPRRIELWLEAPTNALLESGIWQQVFKDLRPGSILVIHESQTRKSFTFQRREDQVRPRGSPWSRPLAWEPGLRLSSRDVIDLLQQLQFIANSKAVKEQSLTVSILGEWEPYHGKMLINLLNQWGNIPFEEIEVQAPRLSSDILLRLRRNHVGKFIEMD